MFDIYNQRTRYIELIKQDKTAPNDTIRQALFYIGASDFNLRDNFSLVYDFVLHDLNPDVEYYMAKDIGPFAKPAIKAMVQRALHMYAPELHTDVSDADFLDTVSTVQATVMADAKAIAEGTCICHIGEDDIR